MTVFLLRLAARTLRRRPARSVITLGSIALGIGTLTFLGAIMVGVNDAMIANSIALHVGNVLIRSDNGTDLVEHWRGWRDRDGAVEAVLPRLVSGAILTTQSRAASVQLIGVAAEREEGVSAVPARIERGRYLAPAAERFEIIIGDRAAESLGVGPAESLEIRLVDGSSVQAVVAGVFRTGIERFDESMAYAPLDRMPAIGLTKPKGETAVFLRKGADRERIIAQIKSRILPGESVHRWEELLPELEQLLRLNVASMFIVIVLVVIMMAAAVSNTVLVSVLDRYREFGVLKALGTTPGEVVRLVLMETALICVVAGTIGLALGSAIAFATARTGIDLGRFTSENIHFVLSSVVHPRLTWHMAFAPALIVLVAGLLASLWPACIAARRRAAEVLRLSA